MQDALKALKSRLLEIDDLTNAAAVLDWDQATFMPKGGAPARARQRATLKRLAHDRFVDPGIGVLLGRLTPWSETLPADADDAALIRVTRREYERAVQVPSAFIDRFYTHTAATYAEWLKAREENRFAGVADLLQRTLEMSREYATFFPGAAHVADPLIDNSDPGMTLAKLRPVFTELRSRLVPLVKRIAGRPAPDDGFLSRHFPAAQQLAFGREVSERFGFDFNRGREDQSPHPFTIRFSTGDIRVTTRIQENFLPEALFSSLHEVGHGLYEQGIDPALEGTPLSHGTSAGVHESQSRLWENMVGRGLPFWSYFYPRLKKRFDSQLGDVPLMAFYQAINRVTPSLIRTDADEVTYNLHVMIRFDLEEEMLDGRLKVTDLPEAWRARMLEDLGVVPNDDRDGVLQDVHWYCDFIGGAFQGYALGNLMAAQCYEAALFAHPEISEEIAQGRFDTLGAWLKRHIHRHGRKYDPDDLIRRVTGFPLQVEPFMRYLEAKYGDLYGF